MDVIVADLEGTEAIMGLDFLTKYESSIDTSRKTLHLSGLSQPINLLKPYTKVTPRESGCVELETNLIFPAQSQLEVNYGKMEVMLPMQTALIEGHKISQQPSVMVATAVVECTNMRVPIPLLNLAGNDVTLYKGTRVAEATVVDHPLPISEVHESHMQPPGDVPEAKQHQLWKVVEDTSCDLTEVQHHQLFALLLEYADVFATDSGDLGSTTCVQHSIETGNARPIRQPP